MDLKRISGQIGAICRRGPGPNGPRAKANVGSSKYPTSTHQHIHHPTFHHSTPLEALQSRETPRHGVVCSCIVRISRACPKRPMSWQPTLCDRYIHSRLIMPWHTQDISNQRACSEPLSPSLNKSGLTPHPASGEVPPKRATRCHWR